MIRVLQEQKEHKGHLDPRGLPDLADLRFVLFILKKMVAIIHCGENTCLEVQFVNPMM